MQDIIRLGCQILRIYPKLILLFYIIKLIVNKILKIPILKRLIPSVLKLIGFKKKVKVGNFYLNLDCSYSHEKEIFLNKEYEKKQILYFEKLIKKNNTKIFIDVGANIGFYSLFFENNKNNLSEFHCFEVNKLNFQRLKKNIKINNSKIKTYNLGCSDKTAKSKIWYTEVSRMPGSSILDMNDPEYKKYDKKLLKYAKINLVKIDDVMHYSNKCIAIKIDVERHELHVLKGAIKLLKNNKIIIQIEIFPELEKKVLKYLNNLNFKILRKINYDYFLIN